jgi:hypothetical protein
VLPGRLELVDLPGLLPRDGRGRSALRYGRGDLDPGVLTTIALRLDHGRESGDSSPRSEVPARDDPFSTAASVNGCWPAVVESCLSMGSAEGVRLMGLCVGGKPTRG